MSDKLGWVPRSRFEEARIEIERLRRLLNAARICLKKRNQSAREAAVYAAICKALGGE